MVKAEFKKKKNVQPNVAKFGAHTILTVEHQFGGKKLNEIFPIFATICNLALGMLLI